MNSLKKKKSQIMGDMLRHAVKKYTHIIKEMIKSISSRERHTTMCINKNNKRHRSSVLNIVYNNNYVV